MQGNRRSTQAQAVSAVLTCTLSLLVVTRVSLGSTIAALLLSLAEAALATGSSAGAGSTGSALLTAAGTLLLRLPVDSSAGAGAGAGARAGRWGSGLRWSCNSPSSSSSLHWGWWQHEGRRAALTLTLRLCAELLAQDVLLLSTLRSLLVCVERAVAAAS